MKDAEINRQLTGLMRAREEFEQARVKRADAIRAAGEAGLSTRQIAALVGLSHQRVAQIIRGE